MEFSIKKYKNKKSEKIIYYIVIGNIYLDTIIADLLDLTFDDYVKLILSYNAESLGGNGFIFLNGDKAQKFADYLNEKYLVIIKLRGKI